MSKQLFVRLNTALAILDQFQSTLSNPPETPTASNSRPQKDVLPLLSASTEALKSQVTKLSLLTINTPFTPSAISTVLSALIESVLPSLMTAALLVTPGEYTKAFHGEIGLLVKSVLNELSALAGVVKGIAEKNEKTKTENARDSELSQPEKDTVTLTTGRVWDACDALSDVAAKGVVGFVIRRVEEWRDLVGDAVKEIEEWDPDDEEDGFFEDILGATSPKEDDTEKDDSDGSDSDSGERDATVLRARKKSALRVLKPVAQVFSTILTNRLRNAGNAPSSSEAGIERLQSLMSELHSIPDFVDEVAGALYDGDLEKLRQYLEKARGCATNAVNTMALPLNGPGDGHGAEDKFTIWSSTWLKVMEEVSKPTDSSNAG